MAKNISFKDFHGKTVNVGDQVTLLYKSYGFRGIDRAYFYDTVYLGKGRWGYEFENAGSKWSPVIRIREPQCIKLRSKSSIRKASFDVGIDFTSIYEDYGSICGCCLIYSNNNTDDVDVRRFIYEYSTSGCVEILSEINRGDWLTIKEKEQVENILLDNIKTNVDVSRLPNVKEYEGGKRYA